MTKRRKQKKPKADSSDGTLWSVEEVGCSNGTIRAKTWEDAVGKLLVGEINKQTGEDLEKPEGEEE